MYVFRVENSKFEGPYQNNDRFLDHDNLRRWPNDRYDMDRESRKRFTDAFDFNPELDTLRFGFRTLESLTRWFGDDFDTLFRHGYGGSVYEVDAHYVLHGYKQLLFVAHRSIKIAEFPL